MKALLTLIYTLLFVYNMAFAGDLVTGKTKYATFEPGDQILAQDDFSQCPVGEIPSGFEKITGAVECVKYEDQIWVAPSTDNDMRLYKKVDLGRDNFSIDFDLLEYQDIGGAIGPKFILRLLESRGPAWDKAKVPYDVEIQGFYNTCAVKLEGIGEVTRIKAAHKKKTHIAIQVRRGQFRIYVDGKRTVSVPFDKLTPNEHISGFEFMFVEDTNAYGMLLSNWKAAQYTHKESKPTPEKIGIGVEKTEKGMKLTVPERVLFDLNKFTLKPEAKEALSVVADVIRENPFRIILVTGYTDDTGSEAYNLRLSLQRAQSVADFLMYCEKIDADKFQIEGKGEAEPIADNKTEAGRAKNRRVEIKLLK
ncbi:OmpA family protein [Desulfacinum hydrothermale DSM 13146]|uniref:OmpA family protein n=1 Tax=Desulfacinum hydrothermale DSM 13146 TaxID=1121390 RepID=A0A1W1X456_9BACT|nr:OmpA family protein [Desulfacinum hydrothermale]SMC18734.1 OmpA family protein [Desulfacinum hydrothermale DSM 13146]